MTEPTRRPSDSSLSEINITPLIDVMLVLLIIFMVVTPTATRSLDASLPAATPPDDQRSGPSPLVVEVGQDGLRLNRAAVTSFAELGERLRDIFAARSDKTLFVRAEGAVPYETMVEALDVAHAAGALRIGILGAEAPGASVR